MAGHILSSGGPLPSPRRDDAAAGDSAPADNLLRVAALTGSDGRRQLCRVREDAPGRLAVRLLGAVAPGDLVSIELAPGPAVKARIGWAGGGLAFLILDPDSADAAAADPRPPRPVRHGPDRLAMIRTGSEITFAATRNLSRGGACLACEWPLAVGTPIILTLEGHVPIGAVVRWNIAGTCGVSFDRPIPPRDFARLVRFLPGWGEALS